MDEAVQTQNITPDVAPKPSEWVQEQKRIFKLRIAQFIDDNMWQVSNQQQAGKLAYKLNDLTNLFRLKIGLVNAIDSDEFGRNKLARNAGLTYNAQNTVNWDMSAFEADVDSW